MTICIGAVCSDAHGHAGKAVVTSSDRMVTMGSIQEFEHEVPKVTEITQQIVSLIAGDAQRGSRLARTLHDQFQSGVQSVQQVARAAADAYADMRREQIETDMFRPRGLTMQQFYSGLQPQMLAQLVFNIDNYIATYNYGLDFMIAGVDSSGGHVYHISNPGGSYNDSLPIGFLATGSGYLQAIQSLIAFTHTPSRSLYETIFAVYASKRRAEVAPGVGADTDLTIIYGGGIRRLQVPELDALDKLYSDYQRPVSKEIETLVKNLNLFKADDPNLFDRGASDGTQ